ncbi:OmpA family protein [Tsuneonella sp. HG249]
MTKRLVSTAALVAAAWALPAHAQDSSLAGLDLGSLRTEIQQRYDAGLAMSVDPAIVSANDSRYMWANEAKTQCGIALGYLKSGTRDEVSIGKCEMAARFMNRVPAPMPVAVAPAPPSEVCSQRLPGIVFFEFDVATLPADANQTVEFVSRNAAACGWTAFDVIGHADRAGSDAYNVGLSERRAQAVAALMSSMGIPSSAITTGARGEEQPRVPTEDGVRNPQNRRVEIGVR